MQARLRNTHSHKAFCGPSQQVPTFQHHAACKMEERGGGERERGRERDTGTQGERQRESDRETEIERERERDSGGERERERESERARASCSGPVPRSKCIQHGSFARASRNKLP